MCSTGTVGNHILLGGHILLYLCVLPIVQHPCLLQTQLCSACATVTVDLLGNTGKHWLEFDLLAPGASTDVLIWGIRRSVYTGVVLQTISADLEATASSWEPKNVHDMHVPLFLLVPSALSCSLVCRPVGCRILSLFLGPNFHQLRAKTFKIAVATEMLAEATTPLTYIFPCMHHNLGL